MGRMWAIILAIAVSGCRAPTPSFNFLAPYGSATVPPPATGSVGTGSGYYAPPGSGAAPPSAGVVPPSAGVVPPSAGVSPPSSGVVPPGPATAPSSPSPVYTPPSPAVPPPVSYLGAAQPAHAPVSEFNAIRASYESVDAGRHGVFIPSSVQSDASSMTALPHGNAADRASSLRLNGMRVNDATRAAEPGVFMPPAGAIPMADPLMSNGDQQLSSLRIVRAPSASAAAIPAPAPAGEPTASNGAWRSR